MSALRLPGSFDFCVFMDKKVFYITREKAKEIKEEYDNLIAFERRKTMGEEAPKVLESEDLNPEFVSFQEDLDLTRSRVQELKDVLDNHEIIKKPPREQRAFVNVGATVRVDIGRKKNEFTIVGTLEANPDLGKISNESPLGRALIGRGVGDEVVVLSPDKTKYKIRNIKYEIS